MSIRVLAAAAGWLAPAKYFNKPWGINTAYSLVPAGVVCLHCGRFPHLLWQVIQFRKTLHKDFLIGYKQFLQDQIPLESQNHGFSDLKTLVLWGYIKDYDYTTRTSTELHDKYCICESMHRLNNEPQKRFSTKPYIIWILSELTNELVSRPYEIKTTIWFTILIDSNIVFASLLVCWKKNLSCIPCRTFLRVCQSENGRSIMSSMEIH
jgi:hypothetical protein